MKALLAIDTAGMLGDDLFDQVSTREALDLRGRACMVELVGGVLKVMRALADEGRTMLVVTHEMEFAREVASQAIFLHQGLIEEQGLPREVLVKPRSERLRQFLSGGLK